VSPGHLDAPSPDALPSRRAFCASLGLLLAAATLPGAALTPDIPEKAPDPHPLKLTEATRADLGPGKVLDYRKLGLFFLVADDKGIYALSAICTHLGCTVHSEGSSGFGCPCHDSAYDLQGEVTEGPAKRHLRHLEVRETAPDGLLLVDVSSTVPPESRLN
jgi:cytochrome b6-f complex iron-sulfur subunit